MPERRLLPALVAALALAAAPTAADSKLDLLNLALSPELASWLVGANARLATKAEQKEFLALVDDAAAAAWIERFWEKRDPDPSRAGNPVRELAESRAEEADRRFSEAGYAGRRTDRGTIWVLHGEPAKIENEPNPLYGEPPLELWRYEPGGAKGLDGRAPERLYRFARRDDLTTFYWPGRPGRFSQREPWQRDGGR